MLTGYISSTSGQVLINGTDILEEPNKAKANIGYLPEIPPLRRYDCYGIPELYVRPEKCKFPRKFTLKTSAVFAKLPTSQNVSSKISQKVTDNVWTRSGFYRQPPVLILDEPTVGLGPKSKSLRYAHSLKTRQSHTVILSSHILPEIQAVCDRIVIIKQGCHRSRRYCRRNRKETFTNEHKMVARIEGLIKNC